MARRAKGAADNDLHQLHIDWPSAATTGSAAAIAQAPPVPAAPIPAPIIEPLVQRLPWDFRTSFPQPTDEAIDNGLLDESDRQPENLRSLHANYFAQCLATLRERDAILDARRKQIDPETGCRPRTHAGRERLRTYFAGATSRLEHALEILIGTYADGFGAEAAEAFRKAVTARHAGIEVVCEQRSEPLTLRPPGHDRPSSVLPVPRPLRSSIKTGAFGYDENGKPIRPAADEVRAITEQYAERLIDMSETEIQTAVKKYADDFGGKAAAQLERYVHRMRCSR